MKRTIFFDRYCISTAANDMPEEVSRSGAAITYKAIDGQSGENVDLQLIPLAAIDQVKRKKFEERARAVQKLNHINIAPVLAVGVESGYLGVVSASLRGEPADAWVVARGRFSPEAVLRIGIQVLRALAAGAFYGLTHCAIRPSNIMILHAEAPDGGWPLIKLLNFAVAASELHKPGSSEDFSASLGSPFASPEQSLNGRLDFSSEIYSLGATMLYLLTGNVPLPRNWAAIYGGMRTAPELRSLPRPVARLLRRLLHEDPEKRPQDPVALETEMQRCLAKIEQHVGSGRSFLVPAVSLAPAGVVQWRSPKSAVLRGAFAGAALVTVAALASALLSPRVAAMWHHQAKPIGMVVGVRQPEPAKASPAIAAESATAAPVTGVAPTPAPSIAQKPDVAEASRLGEQFGLTESSQIESNSGEYARRRRAETLSKDSSSSSSEPVTMEKASGSERTAVSSVDQKESAAPVARALPVENQEADVDASSDGHPRFIGLSADGRPILRLPSGEIVTVSRHSHNNIRMLHLRRVAPVESNIDNPPNNDSDFDE